MAETITSVNTLSVSSQLQNPQGLTTAGAPLTYTDTITYTNGTGANQVAKEYVANAPTLSNGAPVNIDLTSLTDPLGNALNFSEIVSVLLKNRGTSGQAITLAPGASNGFLGWLAGTSPSETVQPGGRVYRDNPNSPAWTVDSTHKVITLTVAAGTNVPYDLIIQGH